MFEKDKILVVDAGNTSVKWTAFAGDAILWCLKDVHLMESISISQECSTFKPDRIYFASVRSSVDSCALQKHLKVFFGKNVGFYELNSDMAMLGVANPYDDPESLGIDRWLSVIAVNRMYRDAAIIIDIGTALKVEVLGEHGCYCGGYIAPSFDMMVSSLVVNTGRIKIENNNSIIKSIDTDSMVKSTGSAVHSGCWLMLLSFVRGICEQHHEKRIIFTGGNGLIVMKALGFDFDFEAELVALGAKCLGDELVGRI